jgi:hypothetical protein
MEIRNDCETSITLYTSQQTFESNVLHTISYFMVQAEATLAHIGSICLLDEGKALR